MAQRFMDGLRALEQQGDAGPLAALFAADAETGNVIAPEKFHGPEGAREFWSKYRDTFEKVESTFRNQIMDGDRIALEWDTKGSAAGGAPVQYSGVSIIEVAGDRISRFRAYFDPTALGRQVEK